MKTPVIAVLTACLALAACAGAPVADRKPDVSPCLPGSAQCAIYDFAMADEIVLRANGEAIAVDCPESFESTAEQRQARCSALIRVALSLLGSRFPDTLGEIRPERVRYEDAGECAGADCRARLRARVPLPWIVPLPGEAAGAEPILQ